MMSQFGEPSADIDDRAGMCGGVVFFFFLAGFVHWQNDGFFVGNLCRMSI